MADMVLTRIDPMATPTPPASMEMAGPTDRTVVL
jgi:hypothetical protein